MNENEAEVINDEKKIYYVYMLRCEDSSLYTGLTTDYMRRFYEHSERGDKAAKYTHTHKASELVAVWRADDRSSAGKLEYRIKQLKKAEKEELLRTGETEKIEMSGYERVSLTK